MMVAWPRVKESLIKEISELHVGIEATTSIFRSSCCSVVRSFERRQGGCGLNFYLQLWNLCSSSFTRCQTTIFYSNSLPVRSVPCHLLYRNEIFWTGMARVKGENISLVIPSSVSVFHGGWTVWNVLFLFHASLWQRKKVKRARWSGKGENLCRALAFLSVFRLFCIWSCADSSRSKVRAWRWGGWRSLGVVF